MKINIEVIPHAQHRYETVGDWWVDEDGVLQIRVSKMKDPSHSNLVVLHELVEVLVESMKRGDLLPPQGLITSVDLFDERYERERAEDDETSEPGYDAKCPVYKGHMVASAVEHLAAMLMGVDYNAYQAAIADL